MLDLGPYTDCIFKRMDEVAATDPDAILKVTVSIDKVATFEQAQEVAVGFRAECPAWAADIIKEALRTFITSDCSLLEINPMAKDSKDSGTLSFFVFWWDNVSLYFIHFKGFTTIYRT